MLRKVARPGAVAVVLLLYLPAPLALSPALSAPDRRLRGTGEAMLRLRGGKAAAVEQQQGGSFDFGRSFSSGAGRANRRPADATQKDGPEVHEALFQLTTQLFGNGAPQGKKCLYDVLEVSKTATQKEIRDSYYKVCPDAPLSLSASPPAFLCGSFSPLIRFFSCAGPPPPRRPAATELTARRAACAAQLARQWHPDKNKEDPGAEARCVPGAPASGPGRRACAASLTPPRSADSVTERRGRGAGSSRYRRRTKSSWTPRSARCCPPLVLIGRTAPLDPVPTGRDLSPHPPLGAARREGRASHRWD